MSTPVSPASSDLASSDLASSDPASSDTVLAGIDDGVGRLVLDRPQALNALTTHMVERLRDVLAGWADEPLRAIVIESSSDRAFCAGGDIRQIRQNTLDGDLEASRHFFATEYEVNHLLGTSRVPVVALIDGVCMGGGLGLSVHGAFRVVGDRAVLAMPETSIGFFPDVGATHFLSRLPGGLGMYLGLTGARLEAADALHVGLATHHVPSDAIAGLPALLAGDDRPVDVLLREASTPTDAPSIAVHRDEIDRVFTAPSVDAMLDRLAVSGTPWAAATRETLETVSRQSLELTHDLLSHGRQWSLRECLDAEYAAGLDCVTTPDFIEGVRAVLVDKDRRPAWGPSCYRGSSGASQFAWNHGSDGPS